MCTRPTITRIIPRLPPIETRPVVRLKRTKRATLELRSSRAAHFWISVSILVCVERALLPAAFDFGFALASVVHVGLARFWVAPRVSTANRRLGKLLALAPEGFPSRDVCNRSAQVYRSCQKKLCTTATSTASAVAAR